MPYNPNTHHRRSIRLQGYDYSRDGLYFITICVREKQYLFGEIVNGEMQLNESGNIAYNCWAEIPQHYPNVILHEFVVMPNHLHGIIELTTVGVEYFRPAQSQSVVQSETIVTTQPAIIGGENAEDVISREVAISRVENIRPLQTIANGRPVCVSGSVGAIIRGFKIGTTRQIGFSVWQRNYHEHIIRDAKSHQFITNYIENNPANWENDILRQ